MHLTDINLVREATNDLNRFSSKGESLNIAL